MSKLTTKLSLFACTLLLCAPLARAAQSNDVDRLFARAVELHQAGDIEGAIREYRAFLILRPNAVEAWSNLGAAYARIGRYKEAIEQYKQALALNAASTQIRRNLAIAYYKAALFSEAAAELVIVRAADQSNKNDLLLAADCHLQIGAYKQVIELLTPVQYSEAADLTIAYLLGIAYIHDQQPEKGQLLIDRILRNGDSAEAHLMMGMAQLMIRKYPGAIGEFERALALNPKLPTVRSLYGHALLSTGDRAGALKAFQSELEDNPNDFQANLYVGMMLNDDQEFEGALKYLKKAESVRPHDLNISYRIANLHLSLGKLAEALRLLEEVVREAPDFIEAHVKLATVYYRLKRKEDGDRQRAIILKLNAEKQAKEEPGSAYRGGQPDPKPVKQPDPKPKQ
jgi:tetratricopeptide (TPR) repeat protein